MMATSTRRLPHIDAHHRVIIAFVAGLLTFFVVRMTGDRIHLPAQIIITWNGFAFTTLMLAWWEMFVSEPAVVIRMAKLQDSSRVLIFLFVIIAAFASLFAVGVLLAGAKNFSGMRLTLQLVLAITTVACSWFLVHTLFALRYAHLYYALDEDEDVECDGSGLLFPNENPSSDKKPDYLDFAYFSFVIGMTCQVSDVQITEHSIRRLALVHGVLSFVYNTVILALSINIASGLF